MRDENFRQQNSLRASPLIVALARWQHAAGDYWPFVCAAPFVSGGLLPLSQREREWRRPPPPELRRVINSIASDEPVAIFVDLRPTVVLPATGWLNRRGFVVVPAIQRWVAWPAVLNSRALVDHLVRFGAECRRLDSWQGIVFVLDSDRRGRRQDPRPVDAFDNRYSYTASRFPSPGHLRAQGIKRVCWVSKSGIATDLESYVSTLLQAGLRIASPGVELGDREFSRQTTNRSHSTVRESEALGPGATLTLTLAQREREMEGRGQAEYRRFVRRTQTRALLVDHLVQGEPYLALDSIVLTAEDDACLRRMTGVFARAFQRVGLLLARDVPSLVEMGFPWVAAELIRDEMPRIPIIGRFDFVRDEHGKWWLLEFNADTPSGVREAIGVEEALVEIVPSWHGFIRPNAGLADALVAAFVEACRDLPSGAALGLLTDAGELEDLAQMAFTQHLISGRLARLGVPVVLGDVDNLRSRPSGLVLNGRGIGALYRYIAFESMFGSQAFVAIGEAAASGRLRLLNGLFGLLLQHKGLVAWLWSNRADPLFSLEEQAAIAEHVPPTWNLAERTAWPGLDLGPDDVVLKQAFGREGEEVFFGGMISPEQWALLRRRRTYIAQQRVKVSQHLAIVPTVSGRCLASGHVTVGAFAVNGQWAGYYSRFGGEIINAQAKWLATLVDPMAGTSSSL